MGKTGWAFLAIMLAAILSGCYQRELLVADRLEKKVAQWQAKNPEGKLTPEVLANLRQEAESEEDDERSREKAAAAADAVSGAVAVGTGNYLGGGMMIAGAIAVFLGLRRRAINRAKVQGGPIK